MVDGLQNLETGLDQELLRKLRLFSLTGAVEIVEREVIGLADHVDFVLG